LRFRQLCVLLYLALGLLAWPGVVRADDFGDIEVAREHYKNGNYEEAIELFKKVLDTPILPGTPMAEERHSLYLRARPVYAAALLGLGQADLADEVILAQLRDDPYYKDKIPRGLPPALTSRFIRVYGAHRAELDALKKSLESNKQNEIEQLEQIRKAKQARLEKLEKLAAEERVIEHNSRLVAMAPFGVGQFQNGDIGLGVFFLAGEVAFIAATIATSAVFQEDNEEFIKNCTGLLSVEPREAGAAPIDCEASEAKLDGLQVANWVTFGSAAVLALVGIIEAQISIETEKVVVKKRAIPPRVKSPPVEVKPMGGPTDTGFVVGVQGRF
jgi:tetratricopeptide (TPR) repeat protein